MLIGAFLCSLYFLAPMPPCTPAACLKPADSPAHIPSGSCSEISRWMQSNRGHPISTWQWWPQGTVLLGPIGLKYSGTQFLASYLPQGFGRESWLKHLASLHVKRPTYLSWSISLRDRLWVYHTSRGYKGAFREHKLGSAIFVLPLCLTGANGLIQERSLHIHLKPWFVQLSPKRPLQIAWPGGQQGSGL